MSERLKRGISGAQPVIPIRLAALCVGPTGSPHCSNTAIERDGDFICGSAVFVGVVSLQKMTHVGNIPDQESAEIPGRIPAASLTEVNDAGYLTLVDEYPAGIERAVQKMTDRTQVEIVGIIGKNAVDPVHSGIIDHAVGTQNRDGGLQYPIDVLPPGVVLALDLSAAKIGCLLEVPETWNTDLVYGPNRPAGLADEPVTFLRFNICDGQRYSGQFFNNDEVARVCLPPEIGGQHAWCRGP